jgi:hypothetical protein
VDKPDEIPPDEAVTHQGDGPLPDRRPDPTEQGVEADAVFVGGPELDARLGEGRRHLPQQGAEVFLKASCCAWSANAWR